MNTATNHPAERHSPEHTPRLIHAIILLVTSGLTVLVVSILGPSLPKMQAHFAPLISNAEYWVPMSMTIPTGVMAVISVFIGALSDRVGRKRLLVWSTALYAVFGTMPLYVDSFAVIFASRACLGIMEGALMTTSTAMIGDYFFGARRERLLSLQATTSSLAALVFSFVGGVVGVIDWRAPYAMYAISLILAPLMMIFLWEPKPKEAADDPELHVRDDPGVTFRPRLLALICAVAMLAGIAFLIVPVHLGALYAAIGVHSGNQIGLGYAIGHVGIMAGTLTFGWILVTRLRVPAQLALGAAIAGVGFIMMESAGDFNSLTLAALVNGFGSGILLPTMVTWNMRELPFAKRGFGTGAFQSALMLGMAINPLIVVSLEQSVGSRAASVAAIGAAMVVLAATALIASLTRRAAPVRASR